MANFDRGVFKELKKRSTNKANLNTTHIHLLERLVGHGGISNVHTTMDPY